MAADGESLESWLNKATNPSNRQEDWEFIMGFCDQINKELEGPQISVRLLAHKIQSPQEWEAVQALTYLGDRVSEKVKAKVIEMLYSWTISLSDETKISEAYQMLKRQGIVSVDPTLPPDGTLSQSPLSRPKNPVFANEEKSRRLTELLKSKKPDDLQEANRLIKNMVKEDEMRMLKQKQQKSTLEEVNNSVKLLNEMLSHFSTDDSTDGDKELIKDLYGDCNKFRRIVFQLATETEDDDSSLGVILQASDDLSRVINSYKEIVEGQIINGDREEALKTPSTKQNSKPPDGTTNQSEILIDLAGLDLQSPSSPDQQFIASSHSIPADLLLGSDTTSRPQFPSISKSSTALSLLDGELLSLGLNDPVSALSTSAIPKDENWNDQEFGLNLDLCGISSVPATALSMPEAVADALSTTIAAVSLPHPPKADSTLSFPGPVFSTPPLSTELVSTSVILPQPILGPESTSEPLAALFPSHSTAFTLLPSAATLTNPAIPLKVSGSGFFSPSASAQSVSLTHTQQDFDMLDLGRPKTMPGTMDNLLGMGESLAASTALSSCPGIRPSTSILPLVGGMQADSIQPFVMGQADDSPLLRSLSPVLPLSQASPAWGQEISLADVHVSLDAIKPSKVCPITAYDKDGVRVLLHFSTNCPPGRPDVLVMVASIINTAPLPVRNIVLQAAVPKSMKVRLQPPSGTELAPFNPILPPAAITQVVLLANPLKEKVRMRYKLTFTLGELQCTEVGEVDQFPHAEKWRAL
ncbi:ADP-ribosylation factor-binding protein GGA3-like [Lampris incognitus]|uniref:ADP-ribosylation factor-binding protein GGA3-like n=1 Tax=Lampris incognitus TaxID=2546036 RepID=UPI0024B5E8C0|nr:ADP-ribosylation factor-binding protein GGA3-like [Lampris incognitus]